MLKTALFGLAFTILLWQPATAQNARQASFTIGYDVYTLQRALEAKSSSVEYDQDSSGFMFAAESAINDDGSLIFEYRDAGEGSIRCTSDFGVLEIDGEDWECDEGDEVRTEAYSFAIAYKAYNQQSGYWKFGLGSYRIIYHDSNVPEKKDIGPYIGWGIKLDGTEERTGTYLEFGATLDGTFGIGVAYQFDTN